MHIKHCFICILGINVPLLHRASDYESYTNDYFYSTFIGVSVFVLNENYKKVITLKAHRPNEIVTITLCLWIHIAANTSKATVLSFGVKLRLKIYYENDCRNFSVNFYNWNR